MRIRTTWVLFFKSNYIFNCR